MPLLRSLPAWIKARVEPESYTNAPGTVVYCPDRCGHNAVAVGKELLVWGGYHERARGSEYCDKAVVWSYYLDHDIWFGVRTEGQLPQYRSGSASTVLWPYWYIIGGHTYLGDTNDVFRLNLLTLEWDQIKTGDEAETLSPRDKASAWTFENRIYCFGGYGVRPYEYLWSKEEDKYTYEFENDRGWNNQIVYLDTESWKWVRPPCKGRKPLGRAAHTTVNVDGIVYLFGGRHDEERLNDLHCFHLETHTWSGEIQCNGKPPSGRSWHSMSKVKDGGLIVYGGFSTNEQRLDDIWLLNISTFTWSLLREHTGLPRLWHTSNTTTDGDTLVFGGCENNILDSNELMITSTKVILLRQSPFSLERLCLHTVYKYKSKLQDQWSSLPRIHQEWLEDKELATKDHKPPSFLPNVIHGLGPEPKQLVLMKEDRQGGNSGIRNLLHYLFHAF